MKYYSSRTYAVILVSSRRSLDVEWQDRYATSGKYPFTFLLKKKRAFLCFTPPENEFGNQLFFSILGSSSTFRLFRSYESKKVSGRFPDAWTRKRFSFPTAWQKLPLFSGGLG